jgi:hypothetical protein
VHVVLLFQVVVVLAGKNVPDVLVMAGKRKQGYEYLSIRQEIAETKLRELKENRQRYNGMAALQRNSKDGSISG